MDLFLYLFCCFLCRILFPFMSGGDSNISNIGLCRVEGRTDPDDYLDIESGVTYTGVVFFLPRILTTFRFHLII